MWYAKSSGAYVYTEPEAKANAIEIANALTRQKWKRETICALLGNAYHESGLNPWRWQSDFVPQYDIFQQWDAQEALNHGYGLFQFTPANKYINDANKTAYSAIGYKPNFFDVNGSPQDGKSQVRYFGNTAAGNWLQTNYNYYYSAFSNIGVDISKWYYTTYINFINGINNSGEKLSIADLTGCFELCYERPAVENAANSYQSRVNVALYFNKNLPARLGRKTKWIYYMKGVRKWQ